MPFSNHGEAMIKRGKTVNRNAITLTIVALLALTGVSANASLLGDDVTLTSAPFPYDPSNPDSATVDGSVEFQGPEFSFLPGWTLDLASESIQLRLESDGSKSAFGSWSLDALDWIDPATGGTIPGTITSVDVALNGTSLGVRDTQINGSFTDIFYFLPVAAPAALSSPLFNTRWSDAGFFSLGIANGAFSLDPAGTYVFDLTLKEPLINSSIIV